MIPNSNTIVYPRTVVIKSLNTSIAKCAVSGTIGSNHLTVWTKIARIKFLNHSLKLHIKIN